MSVCPLPLSIILSICPVLLPIPSNLTASFSQHPSLSEPPYPLGVSFKVPLGSHLTTPSALTVLLHSLCCTPYPNPSLRAPAPAPDPAPSPAPDPVAPPESCPCPSSSSSSCACPCSPFAPQLLPLLLLGAAAPAPAPSAAASAPAPAASAAAAAAAAVLLLSTAPRTPLYPSGIIAHLPFLLFVSPSDFALSFWSSFFSLVQVRFPASVCWANPLDLFPGSSRRQSRDSSERRSRVLVRTVLGT
eukprot:766457-Hanusia_phi.AAC.8